MPINFEQLLCLNNNTFPERQGKIKIVFKCHKFNIILILRARKMRELIREYAKIFKFQELVIFGSFQARLKDDIFPTKNNPLSSKSTQVKFRNFDLTFPEFKVDFYEKYKFS